MNIADEIQLKRAVSTVFRPGAPVDKQKLFAGRQTQINDVLNATLQPGRHVVLFGERGVGKTSLARIIAELVSEEGHLLLNCHTVNCDSTDDFSTLWRKVFREISLHRTAQQSGFVAAERQVEISLEELLPNREISPDDVRFWLSKLKSQALIIIDEVDKLVRYGVNSQLAQTIKTLSDHTAPVTLILIGVADSVTELIAEHESIERALVQVPMQRMSRPELLQIIKTGLLATGLEADPGVELWIPTLSQGLPHYTHSLALYAAYQAIESGRKRIEVTDVLEATKTTVEKSHTVRTAYNKAISSPQKNNLYAEVLRACALADTDELGYFRPADLCTSLSAILKRKCTIPEFRRHLLDFCKTKRGPVLSRVGEPRNMRFRFVDPMMQPFVIIHDYSISMLTNDLLRKSKGRLGKA